MTASIISTIHSINFYNPSTSVITTILGIVVCLIVLRFVAIGVIKFKIFLAMLTVFIIFLITGCATKIEYVPKVVVKEVKVPVILNIKDISCDFYSKDPSKVVDNLIKCIKLHKEYLKSLRQASERLKKKYQGENHGK